jgi:MFS family permease
LEDNTPTRLNLFNSSRSFLHRQQRDWKVTVARTSLERFTYQMVYPYLSVYIVALGATATQLGIVNSIGMAVAGLLGPFTGGLIDRNGPKKLYLLGIVLLAVSYLVYGLAQNWSITIIAMIAYWLGWSTSIHSCATICGNCLVNRDRATGMMICEAVAAGLLGMAGPMLATWLVAHFGGVNIEGIRPLFWAGLIVTIGSFIIVLTQLSNQKWSARSKHKPGLMGGSLQVLKNNRYIKRWMVISAVANLPFGMILPFSQVFAHQIKGADEFVLGAMVAGSALASIALSIPLGRLADRFGRKKVLFTIIPLYWAANLLLIWAPGPSFLIVAGALQGFFNIGGPISSAIERELVPADQMGRWIGLTRLARMMLNACLAFAAGLIWDKIGPQYVFIIFVGIDLVVRVPLLFSVPETLHAYPEGSPASQRD